MSPYYRIQGETTDEGLPGRAMPVSPRTPPLLDVTLPPAGARLFESMAVALARRPPGGPVEWTAVCQLAGSQLLAVLPGPLGNSLRALDATCSVVRVRSSPVWDWLAPESAPLPLSRVAPNKLIALAVLHVLGATPRPMQEGRGAWRDLFQDVFPSREHSHRPGSARSAAVALATHTERARWRDAPDLIALSCVRGDPEAATFFLDNGAVLECLSSRPLAQLRLPEFAAAGDRRLRDLTEPFPLLFARGSRPQLRYSAVAIKALSRGARLALVELDAAIRATPALRFALTPGDVVIFGNMLHGRTPFGLRIGGRRQRWIQRIFGWFPTQRIPRQLRHLSAEEG